MDGCNGPIVASEVCHAATYFRCRYGFGLTVGDIDSLEKDFKDTSTALFQKFQKNT
jgi:hypothetical protein